ncbi:hypothetical protein SK128_027870 [Halocaridina rubra]|uniref:Uncharacterized protein n=1 Tax=Halocaridina rubra TaxID=373956 RepID=A0AAN8ZY47_HALRR
MLGGLAEALVSTSFNYNKGTITLWIIFHTGPSLFLIDRPGLRGQDEIVKLNEAVGRSLCLELDKTHRFPVKGDITVYAFLLAKMAALRELSILHQEALAKFKRNAPHLEFSDLHKEIFNVDS